MKSLENRIPPPFVCLIVALVMWGATLKAPAYPIDERLRYGLAAGVFAFSLFVGVSGIRAFLRARTTINPVDIEAASRLVTGGIFQYTRNPMYVGFTGLLTALAILLGTPWAMLGPLLFFVFTWRFQIAPEERVMQAKFGESYADYRASVRRWL